jgi:hypothetical protein
MDNAYPIGSDPSTLAETANFSINHPDDIDHRQPARIPGVTGSDRALHHLQVRALGTLRYIIAFKLYHPVVELGKLFAFRSMLVRFRHQ